MISFFVYISYCLALCCLTSTQCFRALSDGPLLLIDTTGCQGFEESQSDANKASSRCNDGEAALVLGHVKKLCESGVKQDQIAVISPYTKQVCTLLLPSNIYYSPY